MAVYEQEVASTDFPACRGFWFFWPQKNNIERQKSEYKVTALRVKSTEEYSHSAVKGDMCKRVGGNLFTHATSAAKF